MVVNLQGIANTTSNTQQPKDIVIYQQLQKRSEAKFARLSLISPMQRAGFRDFLLSYNILLSITITQCFVMLLQNTIFFCDISLHANLSGMKANKSIFSYLYFAKTHLASVHV